MKDKNIIKNITIKQINSRKKQYLSLKILASVLTFFLTTVLLVSFTQIKLFNEKDGELFILIVIIIMSFLYFLSFYSISYLNFFRDKENYSRLLKLGFSKKDILKSTILFGRYLTGKNILIGGFLGIILGVFVTWKYKNFLSIILSVAMMIIIFLLTIISLKLSIKKILKEIEENHKTKNKRKNTSFNKLTPFTISLKYLIYNFKRTLAIVIIYTLSAIIFNFSFSTGNSINTNRYILNTWGKANYKLILEDEKNHDIPTHKLQINNPLNEKLEQRILKIEGIERLEKIKSLDTKVKEKNKYIDTLTYNINERLSGKFEGVDLKKNEAIIVVNELLKEEIDDTIKSGKISAIIYDGNTRKKTIFDIKKVLTKNTTTIEIYTNDETISSIAKTSPLSGYYIYSKETKKIEKEIKGLIEGKTISISSKEEYLKDIKISMNILLLGLYVIISILIMFSVTVALNMKFMNITTRKNDFESFRKLGVRNNDIKKMLIIEDFIYVIPILIISFFIGNYLSSSFCVYMDKIGAGYMYFDQSFLGTIANIVLFGVLSILGLKSYDKLKKE